MHTKSMQHKQERALRVVLWGIMNDFGRMESLSRYHYEISSKDYHGFGKLLFKTCEKYKEKGVTQMTSKILSDEAIDTKKVQAYFQGIEKDWGASFDLYLQEAVATKGMQEFRKLGREVLQLFKRVDDHDTFTKMDQFLSLLHTKINETSTLKKGVEGYSMLRLNKDFGRLRSNSLPVATGIPQVDEIMKGWKRGGINLLSGVSNQGKTTFIIQCLLYAVVVLKLKVKLINLEMANEDVYAKIMGLISGLGYHKHNIHHYDAAKSDDRKEHKAQHAQDKAMIQQLIEERLIIKTGTFTDEMIYEELRESEREKFDIVAVDYFQLVELGTDNGNMKAQKLSELQERVRAIVRNSSFAFIWLTQLKEETEKDKEGNLCVHPMEYEIAWCRDLYKGADSEVRVWRAYDCVETRTFAPSIFVGFKKTRFMDRVDPLELGFDGAVGRIGGLHVARPEDLAASPYLSDSFFDNYEDDIDYFADAKSEHDDFNFLEHLMEQEKEREEEQKRRENFAKNGK